MKFYTLVWITALALLAPAVQAGTASSPELTDATGDAAPPVDVVSAWFSHVAPASLTTGEATVDCLLYTCRDAFSVTVKLADLSVAAPAADADPSSVRYYYTMQFTPDAWGAPVTVICVLNLADITTSSVGFFTNQEVAVGTSCQLDASGTNGDAFDVASAHVSYMRHHTEETTLTATHVDRSASTLTVTLIEDLADIVPGTSFTDLTVKTAVGVANAGVPIFSKTPADAAGPGAAWTF